MMGFACRSCQRPLGGSGTYQVPTITLAANGEKTQIASHRVPATLPSIGVMYLTGGEKRLDFRQEMQENLRCEVMMTETYFSPDELSQRIKKLADQLGKGGRSVAELVLSRPEEVALLPAAKVADQLGISESTVVRFATAIGFDGYPALRLALQKQLRQHLNPVQALNRYASQYEGKEAVRRSFQADLEEIAATERALNPPQLAEAARLIATARETHVRSEERL